jgi:hypothetical protein
MTPDAACRSCGALIAWRSTLSGRRIPVDPEPVEGGNIHVLANGRIVVEGSDTQVWSGAPRYRSHFATCPQAGEWRAPVEPPQTESLF